MDISIKCFFDKTISSVFPIQKISSKENSDFRSSSSPVPPVLPLILFFQKKTISGKTRPLKRVIFRSFLTIFVQVSQCHFFFGGRGATTTTRCDATTTTNPRLPGPSPITPKDRIPREGPPHLDLLHNPCPCIVEPCDGHGLKLRSTHNLRSKDAA